MGTVVMKTPNWLNNCFRFSCIVGVGGIGTGSLIELDGNQTLGRTESRMGHLLDAKDYCKLHIVEHYIAKLVNPPVEEKSCRVVAVGNVGNDTAGTSLLEKMAKAGIDTSKVRIELERKTLASVSFLYSDKSSCNVTVSNSAAAALDHGQIESCRGELGRAGSSGIALCLPEVPLHERCRFLQLATECGNYRVASFPVGETDSVRSLKLLSQVDLLALNREEAAAFGGVALDRSGDGDVLSACLRVALEENPAMRLIVSVGADGVYVYERGIWSHQSAVPVEVISSAGAGDALLAGVIAGLTRGLPLIGQDPKNAPSAIDLGLMAAAFSLTSPHSINPAFTLEALQEFAATRCNGRAENEESVYAGTQGERIGQ
jgi:sugar/nucleoside kinase (ribokinase family)